MDYFNVDLTLNEFLIGEIEAVYSDERYLTDGMRMPDTKKIYPLYAGMQLFHYKRAMLPRVRLIEGN